MSGAGGAVSRILEAIAFARAPKEPPIPLGRAVDQEPGLERPACPGCGATRGRRWLEASDDWVPAPGGSGTGTLSRPTYAVVRCEVCALRYTTPRYRVEHRARAFAGRYPFYERARSAGRGVALPPLGSLARLFDARARGLAARRPRPGRLLDLGCGDGIFLDVVRRRGWDCVGVDLEESVVRHARERLGEDRAALLDIERERLPEGPFDAVTMWGVLQLLYRPQRALERIRGVLAPDGLLAIGVSNAASAGARLFRSRWRGLGLPRHLVHFTPRTLERMLTFAGYRMVGIDFETPRWITHGSVDAVLQNPLLRRFAHQTLHGGAQLLARTPLAETMTVFAEPLR
jgi:SAM-dependent methyltransferase